MIELRARANLLDDIGLRKNSELQIRLSSNKGVFKSSSMQVSLPSGNRIRKRSVVWIIFLMATWYSGTSVRRSVPLMVKGVRKSSEPQNSLFSSRFSNGNTSQQVGQIVISLLPQLPCNSCIVCSVVPVNTTPLLKKVFSSVVFDTSETSFLFACGQKKRQICFLHIDFSLCRIQLHHRLPITPSPTHSHTHTHTKTTANILKRH